LNWRFVGRQMTTTRQQSAIFVLCVALSMVTLVALRGFGESVKQALVRDAKQLIAADVIVRSSFDFSPPVLELVKQLAARGEVQAARVYDFYSVARTQADDATLLADLKVVEPGYPFYGSVTLASGKPLSDVLTSGNVVVEQTLLERLKLHVGDPLRLGEATLRVADVGLAEPDRPVDLFSLGPRVFVPAADLAALDLVKPGSRVSYRLLLKVNDERAVEGVVAQLQKVLDTGQESAESYRTSESGVQRFYQNFLFFLGVIGIFTLLLAGIGIQSALTAFLRERRTTIAIIKTLGATRRFVYLHFYAIVGALGVVGAAIGLAAGFGLEALLPVLLQGLLPPNLELTISASAAVQSLALGAFVVGVFTFLPLNQLEELKPSYIFRQETERATRRWPFYTALAAMVLLFGALALWQLGDTLTGLYFAGGVAGLVLVAALLAEGALWLLRRQRVQPLGLRQALRGLFRPGNATRSIIVTLSAALAVLFCIYLVEQNLDATFVQSYPEDAPNLFFLDIQPEQVTAFANALGMKSEFYPVIRATIAAVNGQRLPPDQRRPDGRDMQFGLTYRDHLIQDEAVVGGGRLFRDDVQGVQVSMLDEIMRFTDIRLGDRVTFRVQGIPIDATVTSVRTRTTESAQPAFGFVFPTAVLHDAPQTIFTGVRLDPGQIAAVQTRMVALFPNVSAIDVTEAIRALTTIARRLSQIVRFFMLFSVAAGLLIVVSSIYATRLARIQEAAYYKVLGARSRFVLRVFTLENALLGGLSALLAVVMAEIGSWLIDTRLLELDHHHTFVGAGVVMVVGTMALVGLVGVLASLAILRSRPLAYLRERE